MKWILVMALSVIGQFYLHPSSGYSYASPFLSSRTVKVFWDDSTNAFRVFLYDTAGVEITEALTGPTINQTQNTRLLHVKNTGYSFCDGTSLNEFYIENKTGSDPRSYVGNILFSFPYGKRLITSNHWSCNIHVCNIEFDLTYTEVSADSGTGTGSISVKATSSAGSVRFTRDPNATYDTALTSVDGTYTFSALATGVYIIYALDLYGCKAAINVNVPTEEVPYGTRWRLEYQTLNDVNERIDIEEKEYAGSISYVKGSSSPAQLNAGGMADVNIFDTLKASDISIELISETDNQFFDLFTQDERKFRIKKYRNLGNILTGFTPAVLDALGSWLVDGGGPELWTGNTISIIGTSKSEGKYTLYAFEAGRTYKFGYDLGVVINSLGTSQLRIYITNAAEANLGVHKYVTVTGSVTGDHEFVAPAGADRIKIVIWQTESDIDYTINSFTNLTDAQPSGPVGLELQWMGFVLPMLYSEPFYMDKNYSVTVSATDQIGNLKDLDFTDDYGNVLTGNVSVIDAISMLLRKTDINLPIRESVNIFETTMDNDPEDSALQQAFFDSTIYNGMNCDEALRSLLISFGARLYQADGYWNVDLIEQKGYLYTYRVFNINGQYVTNGSVNTVSNIKGATFTNRSVLRDKSGMITIMPSYGIIRFLVKTNFKNNLLTAGAFEEADIANGQIVGYTFDLTNGTGVNYGIEKLPEERKGSLSALFIDFENTESGSEIILRPEQFDLVAINGPSLTFKFDILFRPYFKEIYSYIDFSIKIGDNYASYANIPGISTATLLDGEYFRVYVDEALEWKTIERKIATTFNRPSIDPTNVELEGPVIIKIRLGNNPSYDYTSITNLKTQTTSTLEAERNLFRAKVHDGTVLRIYELNSGTEVNNSPDIIRPNDYAGGTNEKVWKLKTTLKEPDTDFLLAGALIDNITLSLEGDYPAEFTMEEVVNTDIKQILEVPLLHSDLEISAVNLPGGVDDNAARLSKSFFRLNNGVATSKWKRTYVDEERPLLDILMEMYKAQVTTPSLKLSGSFFTDVASSIGNCFYVSRLDKYFLPSSHADRARLNSFDAELLELKTGPGGEPPNPEVFEFTDEHSTEFNA